MSWLVIALVVAVCIFLAVLLEEYLDLGMGVFVALAVIA